MLLVSHSFRKRVFIVNFVYPVGKHSVQINDFRVFLLVVVLLNVLIDGDFAIKLPEEMDPFTPAPLFCASVTVYKALKISKARPGQWISITWLVDGSFPIKLISYFSGFLAVAYATAMGFRVLAIVAPNDKVTFTTSKTSCR